MRGAPQRGFAAAIFLIRAAISASRGGRPPVGRREIRGAILAEAAALPAQDGVGRDDDQRLPPAAPHFGQAGPKQPVRRTELWAGRRSLVDGELLAQGQVFEGELTAAA